MWLEDYRSDVQHNEVASIKLLEVIDILGNLGTDLKPLLLTVPNGATSLIIRNELRHLHSKKMLQNRSRQNQRNLSIIVPKKLQDR